MLVKYYIGFCMTIVMGHWFPNKAHLWLHLFGVVVAFDLIRWAIPKSNPQSEVMPSEERENQLGDRTRSATSGHTTGISKS